MSTNPNAEGDFDSHSCAHLSAAVSFFAKGCFFYQDIRGGSFTANRVRLIAPAAIHCTTTRIAAVVAHHIRAVVVIRTPRYVTPGCRLNRSGTLRPSIGSEETCFVSNALPSVASVVFSTGWMLPWNLANELRPSIAGAEPT